MTEISPQRLLDLWLSIRNEAKELVESEPMLASFSCDDFEAL